LLCGLLARLVDRLSDLLGLLDHLLDTRCLGLLELLGTLLECLLCTLAERLCQVGLPQEKGLLQVNNLGKVSQHPGCEPIAGFHRLPVCPLGVRLEFLELVDRLRDLLRDGLIERPGLLLVLLSSLLLRLLLLILPPGLLRRPLASGSLLRWLFHWLLRRLLV